MSTEKRLLARADQLINQGTETEASAFWIQVDSFEKKQFVDPGRFASLKAASLSFVELVYGADHTHYRELSRYSDGSNDLWKAKSITAVLHTIREEIVGGWLISLRSLVTAEVFADFLEMAEHYLELGHKDPAAVMIGSVLEDHLRQLATKHGVLVAVEKDGKQVPKKADTLNAELAKAETYNKLDQKSITMWLDLRNNAAHGKYDQYTAEQVQLMLQGVLNFVQRISVR